ncbi:MATE family efflux transporter [Sphingobacterium kyonggiense]
MNNSNLLAKNAFFLYIQMIFGLIIGLYTSRVILKILGIEDYGIFNLVAGVVTMFGLINSAMSSSTSRFLTFELGKGNIKTLKTIFSNSISIHIIISLFICLISFSIGPWFIHNYLKISSLRIEAAEFVFYCIIFSMIIGIMSVPYTAVIIAHEKMKIFGIITTIDSLIKLIIVLMLERIPFDHLKTYGILFLISQILIQLIYVGYCIYYLPESRTYPKVDKNHFYKMLNFAGWSLFGDGAVMMFTQGINILLNIFFGTTINAARGITIQVQNVVLKFVGGVQTAINPQITKSYAASDFKYLHKLIFASSKLSFFLLLLINIPVFFCAGFLLKIWLEIVPDYTVSFVRFMLIITLIDSLANPLIYAAKATGQIRKYQVVIGSLLLLIVPLSYVFLNLGYEPEIVYIVHIIIAVISQFLRIVLLKPYINMSLKEYLNNTLSRCISVVLILTVLIYFINGLITDETINFIIITVCTLLIGLFFIITIGLTNDERSFFIRIFKKYLSI